MLRNHNKIYTKTGVSSNIKSKRGFTLFYALVVVGVIALMAFGVSRTALNEVVFASLGRKSQQAFFAANSGLECALYWDLREAKFPSPDGYPGSTTSMSCAKNSNINIRVDTSPIGGNEKVSKFTIDNLGSGDSCSDVTVTKTPGTNTNGDNVIRTTIISNGKDTCVPSARKVERSIRVNY